MSNSPFEDQKQFMLACNQTVNEVNVKQARMYMGLIDEEYVELDEAIERKDIVEMADALTDMIVVIIGAGLSMGLDMEAIWDEVMLSNFRKIDPETGKVIKREDGKTLKPEGWKPPNIRKIIERCRPELLADVTTEKVIAP
jgi:NTP pyrophosphatase (non-canonical NTP hydrolase)